MNSLPGRLLRVHCELGPVLVNRTAVYKMCKHLPGELAHRGLRVTCSALLARVANDTAEPKNTWNRRLFSLSQRWLHSALARPGLFIKARHLTGLLPRLQGGWGIPLFMDPVYMLFYGAPQRGVVLVYDITTVTDAGWHGAHICRLYEVAFRTLSRSRCHIVASCKDTADQLRANWGIAPSRLTVLPLGLFSLPSTPLGKHSGRNDPFLLFVGNLEPRKNVPGLIHAFRASGLYSSQGIRLRIIGSLPGDDHPVVTLARSTPGVDLRGFVSDRELAESYERCLAFVYPSFCEGFGLPLLEAMQRGCVCLSTTMGASPEIAGDAALYVNPYSTAEIAGGLCRVVSFDGEHRQRLMRRAKERARLFTWSRFYDGLAQVLAHYAAAA